MGDFPFKERFDKSFSLSPKRFGTNICQKGNRNI